MPDTETLFKNATVFDGEVLLPESTLHIRNNRISAVYRKSGPLPDIEAIDCTGMMILPGCIDIHTHYDFPQSDETVRLMLSQGITTIITGNCGISAGTDNGSGLQGIIDPDGNRKREWDSTTGYMAWLENHTDQLGVNYAGLVGHHTLLLESQKTGINPLRILERALENGSLGLSFGLEYGLDRNILSPQDIQPYADCLAAHKKILAVHVRDQGPGLYAAVEMFTDLFDLTKNRDLRIQISHLKHKFMLDANGHKTLTETLKLIRRYFDEGWHIGTDVYPYTAGMTVLIPGRQRECRNGWDDVYPFGSTSSIGSSARDKRLTPDAYVQELLRGHPGLLAVYRHTMREEDVREILDQPFCIIGSDALPRHPRAAGTFPKIIRRALDSPEPTPWLAKCTSRPAMTLSLPGRGFLRPGYHADFVIMDPATIRDTATFENPMRLSTGVGRTYINGHLAYDSITGVRGKYGTVIRTI